MHNRVLSTLLEFFEGSGRVISTPSGDARGHVRVYVGDTVRRGRSF